MCRGGVGVGGGKEGDQHGRHPLQLQRMGVTKNDLVVETVLEEGGLHSM